MRRVFAIFLLAAFGLPVAAPALALTQDSDARLPVCCRRHGAHHCAGNMLHTSTNAPAASAICPNYPQPGATPATAPFTALVSTQATTTPHFTTLTLAQQAETTRRIARERSRHKRGPPSILL
jgi:hypothetical protein